MIPESQVGNSPSRLDALADQKIAAIRGGIIFARPAVSVWGNAPVVLVIKGRMFARHVRCAARALGAAIRRQQAVVAVREGVLIRSSKQQAATLQINTRNEHMRFRYMHMNPAAMDADGVLSGSHVDEGEKIGVVSNYLDHPNGTTRHLHFDVQVFTRDGWLWVNPYVTLISAYERLISDTGLEIGPAHFFRQRSRTQCRRRTGSPG